MPTQVWDKYAEFYKQSNYGIFPQEHRRSLGKHAYDLISVEQGAHKFTDPEVDETILALPISVEKGCTWSWRITGRQHKERAESGRMVVVPSGVESQWEVNGSRKILMLVVPDSTVHSALGSASPKHVGKAFEALSEASWLDPLVYSLLVRMWECAAGQEQVDRYLADGLLVSILSQLLIKATGCSSKLATTAIPYWRLQRVYAFVESNLDQDITLENLAEAAGFSCRHFARSFRLQTGETPHRWLMTVRLEKAKDLLRDTEFSLCDVADRCGFASQSHMTTVMKNETGYTPRQWRDLQRSCVKASV
jgi:AraC family transcriptional regulator